MTRPPARSPSGAFTTSQVLRQRPQGPLALDELDLQDVQEIQLLLRGDSIVDWHRLALRDESDVRRLMALNGVDMDNEDDCAHVAKVRREAVDYITEALGLRLDPQVATEVGPFELPLLASGRSKHQRHACVLLKVMHIIYHLDAREMRMALPIPDNELFSLVEESVVRMFDELRTTGVPVREFAWSRKTRASLVTKMLVKRETSAARVFDRLRFRLIVENAADLIPTLQVMLRRCIPFNYVVPGQTVNTLVDTAPLRELHPEAEDFSVPHRMDAGTEHNEFSGEGYRILNFIADLPVRVDALLPPEEVERMHARGRVVFVLSEFQIMDEATSNANEQGDNSHAQYKLRQHNRVRERLLREPRLRGENSGASTTAADVRSAVKKKPQG